MRGAEADDYGAVQGAQRRGLVEIEWPDREALRAWAKRQGWPTPRFDFEAAFVAKALESPANFAQAVDQSGIKMRIPREEYTLAAATLQELDALYAGRSPSGRPQQWGSLVEELRAVRRAVEAGVVVQVEDGPRLGNWQEFYQWAHGRYHMLEDGYDRWIGDDG
jgi:hypothetical protein